MNPTLLLVALLAASPAYADTSALAQRKPGLWELQYSVTGTTDEARKSEEIRRRLESMPPEKRAQMEEYRQRTGTGMTMGPDGPVMNMRFCLTPEDIRQESGKSLSKGLEGRDCKRDVVQRSATEVHLHATCHAADGTASESDVRVHDIAPDHYAVDMDSRSAKGAVHMAQKARWVAAECSRTQ
jgi:hypothetical protein